MGGGAVAAAASSVWGREIGVVLAIAGAAWLAWGAAALAAGRLPIPRTAAASTLVTVIGVAALLAATGGRASVLAAAAAIVLLLLVAVMTIAAARRGPAPPGAIRTVPLLLAAAIVAVVAPPGPGAGPGAALPRPDGTPLGGGPPPGH